MLRSTLSRGLISRPLSGAIRQAGLSRSTVVPLLKLQRLITSPVRRLSNQQTPVQTSSENDEKDPYSTQRRSFSEAIARLRQQASSPAGIAIMGGAVALYIAYEITKFLSHITFTNIGEYAFWFGMITAGFVGVAGYSGAKLFMVRPEHLYRMTLKSVSKNPRALHFLGGRALKPGSFRAYQTVSAGTVAPPVVENGQHGFARLAKINSYLRPTVLQMMFTVNGDDGAGMVSAQLFKQGNAVTVQTLYLTNLRNGERVLLEGEDQIIYEKTMQLLQADGKAFK